MHGPAQTAWASTHSVRILSQECFSELMAHGVHPTMCTNTGSMGYQRFLYVKQCVEQVAAQWNVKRLREAHLTAGKATATSSSASCSRTLLITCKDCRGVFCCLCAVQGLYEELPCQQLQQCVPLTERQQREKTPEVAYRGMAHHNQMVAIQTISTLNSLLYKAHTHRRLWAVETIC